MALPLLLINFLLLSLTHCTEVKDAWSIDELYALGVKAYKDQEPQKAIDYLQTAIAWHKAIINQRQLCFNSCSSKDRSSSSTATNHEDDSEMQFFHSLSEFIECILQCRKDSKQQLDSTFTISAPLHRLASSSKINTTISNGDIHTYIQMALYERNELNLASQHATTNYYLNPHDHNARANYEYYLNRDDTCNPGNECKSLETKLYRDLYVNGTKLYNEKEFKQMVKSFELSLKYFFMELKKCRKHCEGLVQYPNGMGFAEAMTSIYMSVLECKQSCPSTLGDFRDSEINTNFFGSYFHYLQYGYYKTDQLQDAVKTSVTQLRIDPKNEVAKMNKAYYQRMPGISNKDYIERKDAEPVLNELMEEKEFLRILQRIMTEDKDDGLPESMDDSKLLEEDFEKFSVTRELVSEPTVEQVATYSVKETPEDHDGVERIVVDDLLTQQQCQDLLELTDACIEGDGYSSKAPHTLKEKFEGLTVLTAAQAAVKKNVNAALVKLYIETSKQARQTVQELFKLDQYLHFSFTHLVCRTAKDGVQNEREDLSHPIHGDNCILEQGDCIKKSPAFTWRDYSAILYLNDDFEGGDFFFAHSPTNLTIQHSVRPKCGRMVGFSAGKENLHGVNAVTKGRRCAVALWFTLDSEYAEQTFEEAEKTLSQAEL